MWLQRGLSQSPRAPLHLQQRLRPVVTASNAPNAPPSSLELLRDARLAALSGLAYLPSDELSGRLQQHGLELQAQGYTHFTRWFVARHSPAASPPAASSSLLGAADPGQRLIFLRGVSWRSADLDALRVWQGLMRALPASFLPHLTCPPELLVAHSGVAEMAEELYSVLQPHMEGQSRLHLGGHSLGGSLATLVALHAHLRLGGSSIGSSDDSSGGNSEAEASNGSSSGSPRRQQGLQVQCTTFGSPPVLALSQGAGEDGRSVLQALKLPLGAFRNYVLQDDPVPRALLSADPAFLALKQSAAVAGLLRLREQWLWEGMLSPSRFLFHPAGDVFLIRWTAEGGHSVRLLAPHTLQEELKLDVEALRTSPLALMQALMDHHHGSYHSELRADAAALTRQESAAAESAAAQSAAAQSAAAQSAAAGSAAAAVNGAPMQPAVRPGRTG